MGLGFPLAETKPTEPPGCLILEDLQTLHIPANKKLDVWTQYMLLLFFQENFETKGDLLKILKNHRPDVSKDIVCGDTM